jgi:single-stranded DNA-specific DHH superfamily exonuclease
MPRSMTGLIAGQLADMYKRPVLIGRTDEHGNYVGSIRSIQGSSIEMFKDFCEASGMFNWVAGK